MLELGVAVGVVLALLGLAVGLEVIAPFRQQAGHCLVAHNMPHRAESFGEVTCTLAGPQQGRHRIAAGGGIDEPLEVLDQGRVGGGQV